MQAREYLPAYGKFAQVDPAYDQTKDDPESWNLYNYTTNNPVTKTDPDGRMVNDDNSVGHDVFVEPSEVFGMWMNANPLWFNIGGPDGLTMVSIALGPGFGISYTEGNSRSIRLEEYNPSARTGGLSGTTGMMLASAVLGAVSQDKGATTTIIDATGGDYLKTVQGTDTGLQKIIKDNNIKVISVSSEDALRDAASSVSSKGTTILIAHTRLDPGNPSGAPIGIEVGSLLAGTMTRTGISSSNPLAVSGRNFVFVGCGAENPSSSQFFSLSAQRAYGVSARYENGGLSIGTRSAISASYEYLNRGRSIPDNKMSYGWAGRSILFGSWAQ